MLVFDTSAFINGRRIHYPPGTFPSVWQIVETAIDDGRIIVPREVLAELEEKDDQVYAWAKARRRRFVYPSDAVQSEVGPILAMFPKPGIRDRADPFVIAEAKVRGFTVVTYEGTNTMTGRRTKDHHKKMPGICARLGVDCCILPEALTLMGVSI